MSGATRSSANVPERMPAVDGGSTGATSRSSYARVGAPALFRLTGPDHREALDRIISQAIRGMGPCEGRLALVLAPKGQFRGLMAVFAGADDMLVAAPAGHGDELVTALGKYLAFSRSRLEPVSTSGAFLLIGDDWAHRLSLADVDANAVARGGFAAFAGGRAVLCLGQTFLGIPGAFLVAGTADEAAEIEAGVTALGARAVTTADLELARIEAGFPAWGAELTDDVLPPEVGLERVAISYDKGCYVGQEVIARLRTYGHTNRVLVRVAGVGDGALPATPAEIVLEGDPRRRGTLTSVARHPRRGVLGLALVRREGAEPGTVWHASGTSFEVLGPAVSQG